MTDLTTLQARALEAARECAISIVKKVREEVPTYVMAQQSNAIGDHAEARIAALLVRERLEGRAEGVDQGFAISSSSSPCSYAERTAEKVAARYRAQAEELEP